METITIEPPHTFNLTDDQLFDLCISNRNLVFERTSKGQIIIMTPAGGKTSNWNSEIIAALVMWNQQSKSGKVFDSSGGFFLPDGSMRAPDAAWIKSERWERLTDEEQEKFPPLAPDFVIELISRSDSLSRSKEKMIEWIDNGASLGWLIDPYNKKAYIFSSDKTKDKTINFEEKLSGFEVLPGFEFDPSILI